MTLTRLNRTSRHARRFLGVALLAATCLVPAATSSAAERNDNWGTGDYVPSNLKAGPQRQWSRPATYTATTAGYDREDHARFHIGSNGGTLHIDAYQTKDNYALARLSLYKYDRYAPGKLRFMRAVSIRNGRNISVKADAGLYILKVTHLRGNPITARLNMRLQYPPKPVVVKRNPGFANPLILGRNVPGRSPAATPRPVVTPRPAVTPRPVSTPRPAPAPVFTPRRISHGGLVYNDHSPTTRISGPTRIPVNGLIRVSSTSMPMGGPGVITYVLLEDTARQQGSFGVTRFRLQSVRTSGNTLVANGPGLGIFSNRTFRVRVLTQQNGRPKDHGYAGTITFQ